MDVQFIVKHYNKKHHVVAFCRESFFEHTLYSTDKGKADAIAWMRSPKCAKKMNELFPGEKDNASVQASSSKKD